MDTPKRNIKRKSRFSILNPQDIDVSINNIFLLPNGNIPLNYYVLQDVFEKDNGLLKLRFKLPILKNATRVQIVENTLLHNKNKFWHYFD